MAEPSPVTDARRRLAQIDAADRAARWAAVILAVIVVVVVLLTNARLAARLDDERAVLRVQECQTRALSKYAAATGDALASPPAPNVDRQHAVARIAAAAKALDEPCRR